MSTPVEIPPGAADFVLPMPVSEAPTDPGNSPPASDPTPAPADPGAA